METTFTFRDIEATEGLKDHFHSKFVRADKYLIKPISAHVILCKDGFLHKVEITIHANGKRYIGMEKTNDMYLSIDNAIDKIVSQLQKDKEKTKNHHHRS